MKLGVMVIVLLLSVTFTGELVVLSAQTPSESTTQKNQSSNDATDGKESTKTQGTKDIVIGKASAGNSKNLTGIGTLLLGIAALLGVIFQVVKFVYKVKSKVDLPYSAEDIDKQNLAEKLDKIQKAVEQNPKASLIEKSIADAYMLQRGDRIEEALEKWSSIANIAEGSDNDLASRALVSVGYLYVKNGIGEKGLSVLNKAIDLRPDYVEAYNNRGVAKNLLGKHKDALADYDTAIRLKSDYVEAYRNRGTAKSFLGRHKDAITDYNKAIQLKSDDPTVYDNRGSAKRFLGKHQEAIVDYDMAIRLKPDYTKAYAHRGHANRTLGKYEEAFEDYDKLIDLQPHYAEAYDYRSSIHFRLGRYREAITDCSKVIQLIKSGEVEFDKNQDNSISLVLQENTEFGEAEAYYNRGCAKSKLGEFADAVLDYDEAIRIKPDFAEAYSNRGNVKIQLKQTHEALADFDEAIKIKPNYADAYNNRGNAKIQLKQTHEALADFDEAIKIKSDYAKAYNNRGGTKIYLNQLAEALIDIDEAIRIKPYYAEAYANRAEAKFRLGIIDESRLDFKIALELAEQQGLTDFKVQIEERLQELSNSTPQTDET